MGQNRKRQREDDDFHHGRHGGKRHRDESPPRQFEEDPLPKVRRVLLNIASSSKLPSEEAADLATDLGKNWSDETLKKAFFDIFVQLLIEQPFKIPFVAAVAFYGNDVNPEIATEALTRVTTRAQDMLNDGKWTEFKLLLRFLACLQPLFEGDGVFTLLNQLFDTVVDLQSATENDMVGIELVKIILLTMPYAIVSGGLRFKDQAQELLDKTAIVASNSVPMEALIHSYVADAEDAPLAYRSVLGLIQTQLVNEAEQDWPLKFIPRFDPYVLRKKVGDEKLPIAPQLHPSPVFTIPSPVNPGEKPLFPEAHFSLYANQDVGTVPRTGDIAGSLIRDAIVDTINQLDFNRVACAKFLVEVDCYWADEPTFAPRGVPVDRFGEHADNGLYKSEDMVIDAIFSQLFKLPNPERKLVYYHSLITECCKIAPAAIAPSLGRAIRLLYQHVDMMDLELANRFLDWFSHHLSNFEFQWRWGEWVEDVSLVELHPKKAFIDAALDREVRLSFAKRIRSTVPAEIAALIPQHLDTDNSPEFKYDNNGTPFAVEGQKLLLQLRKKATNDEIQETINEIHEKAAEQGITDVLVPSTDAFVTAICRLGAKTLSHVLSCVDRGKERLSSIGKESDSAARQIVASVVEYWEDQPGVAVKIINVLLNYTIVSPMNVIQWALGDYLGAGEALVKSWVFELVSNTVVKVTTRNRQIAMARIQKGLPQEQIEMVEATLTKDRDNARELFKYIADQVGGVAAGAADVLIEKETSSQMDKQDGQLIREWAKRWEIVFRRMAQVEEAVVGEEAVDARIKLLPAEPEPVPEPEPMQHDGNGFMDNMDVADDNEIL